MTAPTTLNVISFRYTLKDTKGMTIESSKEDSISYIEGMSQIFPVLEEQIKAFHINDPKKVAVRAAEAFGEYEKELIIEVPRSELGEETHENDVVAFEQDDGTEVEFRLVQFKNDKAVLDGNHPLAGLDLLFEIEVTGKRPATHQELETGQITPLN